MSLRVCPVPGCPALTAGGRCGKHEREQDRARGTRQERGYDQAHDAERRRWAPLVATGRICCARPECGQPIRPGQAWDLGHTDDRTRWTGPEHAKCNRAAGGRNR